MHARIMKMSLAFLMAVVLVGLLPTGAMAQVSSFTPSKASQVWTASDFANAKPMPMPMANDRPVGPMEGGVFTESLGKPGFEPGSPGNGTMKPTTVPKSRYTEDGIEPQEYGSSNHVFTTTRVDVTTGIPSKYYPFRAAGKLYFKIGSGNYVCSASLIKRGIIVTAAHCVVKFGGAWYGSWVFVPAKYDSSAPYGSWNGAQAWAMTSYINGTDSCASAGVVCRNDVAVIRLTAQSSPTYPGTSTGWFGYGWNGYGFNGSNLALINQLGYPVTHDSGNRMQRTDSEGFVSSTMSGNTVWGSRQTGGSSGGPELVNLGILPSLAGTTVGAEAGANTVVGVTSWGYTSLSIKQQGASPFTSTNIGALVTAVCTGWSAACS